MPVLLAARTHLGLVRRNNEDAFVSDPAVGCAVVCDGMGGMAAGEVASHLASRTFIERLHAATLQNITGENPLPDRVAAAIQAANDRVLEESRAPGRHGMGTTLVAVAVEDARALIANVGDSRAYLLRDGAMTQITRDHSYVEELQASGHALSQADLRRYSSVITRAIGSAPQVRPDLYPLDLHPGDTLLLATDGLTRYFEDPSTFIPHLTPPPATLPALDHACQTLIQSALEAGGVDNITVLLLHHPAA